MKYASEDELRQLITDKRARLEELHTGAEGRSLEEAEQTEWDEGMAFLKEAERELKRFEEVRTLAAKGYVEGTDPNALDDTRSFDSQKTRDRNPWDLNEVTRSLFQETPERGGRDLFARATDAVERVRGLNDKSRERITNILEAYDSQDDGEEGRGARRLAASVIATSSPEYQRAWKKAWTTGMRHGTPDGDAMRILQRAASLTDASGGYTVPLPIDPTLILNDDGSFSVFRQVSTVRTIVTDQLRTVNSTAVSASFDAEAAEVSDDTPTWDVTDITVRMARAFIPHSIEIGMDYPGFQQDVAMLFADAKANLETTVFTTGASGSNQPIGIVTALTGGSYVITENTDDVFALTDVYDVDEELPHRFAQNASWMANKKIYQAIREAGGANLDDFWVNLRDGRPNQLLGHSAYENSAMDGVIDTSGAVSNFVLILGDWRNYWIVDRVGFNVELIPHLFHTSNNRPSGQRGIFGYWRVGADSVNDRAFRMLNIRSAA